VKCDRCGLPLDLDETGYYDLKTKEGGHLACFFEPIEDDER